MATSSRSPLDGAGASTTMPVTIRDPERHDHAGADGRGAHALRDAVGQQVERGNGDGYLDEHLQN